MSTVWKLTSLLLALSVWPQQSAAQSFTGDCGLSNLGACRTTNNLVWDAGFKQAHPRRLGGDHQGEPEQDTGQKAAPIDHDQHQHRRNCRREQTAPVANPSLSKQDRAGSLMKNSSSAAPTSNKPDPDLQPERSGLWRKPDDLRRSLRQRRRGRAPGRCRRGRPIKGGPRLPGRLCRRRPRIDPGA